MSDVDISPEAVENSATALWSMVMTHLQMLKQAPSHRLDLFEPIRKLRALSAALTTAQAQIAAARNEGLEMAASYAETYDGSELADGIRALKSTPHAPVRDDEWALRFARFVANNRVLRDSSGHDYWPTPEQHLAAFNAQDNSNE